MDPREISLAWGGPLEVLLQWLQAPRAIQYSHNMKVCVVGNRSVGRKNNNTHKYQSNAGQGKEEDFWEPRDTEKLQDEDISYHGESRFSSGGKEGAIDKESRVKEERKEKVVGSRTNVVGNREEVEGREGAKEERKRREEKTGGIWNTRHNDGANNGHIGWGVRKANS